MVATVTVGEADLPLNLWTTMVGASWTVLVVALLVRGRERLAAWQVCVGCGVMLGIALWRVLLDINALEQIAGLQVLDMRFAYSSADIETFALALGEAGRWRYAAFQLGIDTWAPPAFAGFAASVACATLPIRWAWVVRCCLGAYLAAVVPANALMPIVMLTYPEETAWQGVLISVVPWLDFAKHSLHLLSWGIIVCGWLVGVVRLVRGIGGAGTRRAE